MKGTYMHKVLSSLLVLTVASCHHAGPSPGTDAATSSDAAASGDAAAKPADGSTLPGTDAGGDASVNQPLDRSVLQRGNDLYRRATFTQPLLTKTAATTMAPDTTFNGNATFPANGSMTGQGMASVLYVENGPPGAGCPAGVTGCTASARAAGAGVFLAFPPLGSNPNIIAFDETTGLPVWTQHVDSGSDGIRGTPVVDLATRRIFVVTGSDPHFVRAISLDTGAEVTTGGWPLMLSSSTLSYQSNAFASQVENQHGALLFMNNILYIPFGGEDGDGGAYYGWIVAVDTTDPTKYVGWATRSVKSGIWGAGGLASDGTYVFGVTGNTSGLPRAMSDSEEVVRVKGMAAFTRDASSLFVPTEWQAWDQYDLDFASATPAYVPLPAGSTPASLLVAPGKGGRVFVLDGQNLSSGTYPAAGGELADLVVSNTTSFSVYTAPTVYTSASGIHATINVGGNSTDNAVSCPDGTMASTEEYVSILLSPGKTPIAKTAWCAGGTGGGNSNHPPISTTSDGASADAMVWFLDGGQLTGVDGDTGAKVVTTAGSTCDSIFSMSFPIAVKGRIVVAALGHLCSWSPNGL
ncbi:MAG: hypothetical protein ABI321_14010 [Polyangia bacterium]